MLMQKIDRATGDVVETINSDHFIRILDQQEEPKKFQYNIIRNLLSGGNYATAGYVYQLESPQPQEVRRCS